ncbi:MAG TPA: methionine--tRNA ligase subunit beta [bacterium]|nr:methionine--tRNA ligase subunit beta [bacterium]
MSFEDWLKLDVEIGTIKSVNEVAGADKLYQIALDFGESGETTIIAGIREYYRPSELVGKQVPILKNLAEKEIKGVKSKGMILAVNNGGEAIILSPQKEAKSGSKVS